MKWEDTAEVPCPVARTLSVIGDRWTFLIVRDAFMGIRRFENFQNSLGVTRHVLADRLARLVEQGVLRREPYQQRPLRYEYRITDKGKDLYPVLLALVCWGERWMSPAEGGSFQLEHLSCGHHFTPVSCCSECGGSLRPADVRVLPGHDQQFVG